MRPRSLSSQVTIASVLVVGVVAVAFVVALVAISSLDRSTSRESHSKDVVAATLEVQNLVVDSETGVRGYVISRNPQFLQPWRDARRSWPAAIARLERLVAGNAGEEGRVQTVDGLVAAYQRDYAIPVIQLAKNSPFAALGPLATAEAKTRVDAIRAQLGRVIQFESQRSRARAETVRGLSQAANIAAIVGLSVSALVVLLFGAWVARWVARPVRRVSEAAAEVAAGNFGARLNEGGAGEIGALTHAFNSMTRALEASRHELLAQNAQLRAGEEAKSELISTISHELRTPLASVLGFTSLLLEREFDPEERRRYLSIVDTEARRLAQLADDFLDLRLLEEGRVELALAPVDLAALVRSQARLFFSHAHDHVVTVDVPPGELVVEADRDRLAQVVANLLSNAIKYSPNGGRIGVSVDPGPSTARVSVADDGVGISIEDQTRIFEKFFRGSASAAGIPGTGLGLAVTRAIVEAHGGRVGFESAEGVGSTFWLELPLAQHVTGTAPSKSSDLLDVRAT
jgi:signal transduction histidine kinase